MAYFKPVACPEPSLLPAIDQQMRLKQRYLTVTTERKNRWACAIDSGLLPAIRFSKWRTTNQNNTRHSKGRNAAVLALRTSEFYIIVRHLPSKLWSFSWKHRFNSCSSKPATFVANLEDFTHLSCSKQARIFASLKVHAHSLRSEKRNVMDKHLSCNISNMTFFSFLWKFAKAF